MVTHLGLSIDGDLAGGGPSLALSYEPFRPYSFTERFSCSLNVVGEFGAFGAASVRFATVIFPGLTIVDILYYRVNSKLPASEGRLVRGSFLDELSFVSKKPRLCLPRFVIRNAFLLLSLKFKGCMRCGDLSV